MTWAEQVEARLVGAHRRLERRRRWLRRLTLSATVVAFLAVATAVGVDGRIDAVDAGLSSVDGDMPLSNGLLHGEPASDVIGGLVAAGMDVDVVKAMTGPSLVGTVLRVSETRAGSSALEVVVGVEAPPGGLYEHPSDPFGPGEPLGDVDPTRVGVDQIAAVAAERGLNVLWVPPVGEFTEQRPDGPLMLRLALMLSSDRVLLRVETP